MLTSTAGAGRKAAEQQQMIEEHASQTYRERFQRHAPLPVAENTDHPRWKASRRSVAGLENWPGTMMSNAEKLHREMVIRARANPGIR